jgi:excisionase family DNA binding protein
LDNQSANPPSSLKSEKWGEADPQGLLSKLKPLTIISSKSMTGKRMLTTKQASERLGIQPQSVLVLIRAGRIAAERRGRGFLIDPEEVRRYRRERRDGRRWREEP